MGPTRVRPPTFEERIRPLHIAALGALAPRPHERLLHVGCGTGIALAIAAHLGAEVAGLDASADLLAVARDRLPDADLRLGEPAELPYDRGCFDQVMAFEAVQYAARPTHVVAELARVTRPGGVVVIGLWHNWSGREASAFLNAVRDRAPTADSPPVRDLPLLREMMVEAGLDVYAGAEVTHRYDFPDLSTAWQAMTASPHVSHAIDLIGETPAHQVFLTHFAHRSRPDGTLQQDNLFQYALARATN